MRNHTYAMIQHGIVDSDRTEYKIIRVTEHEFSEDFNAKLARIAKIKCEHREIICTQRFSFKRTGRNIGLALLAASIAMTSAVGMLADAPKEPDFTIEMMTRPSFDDTIEISFINGMVRGTQTFPVMLDYQSPSYIPEGYEIAENCKDGECRYIIYKSTDPEKRNNTDLQIIFSQNNLCGAPRINSEDCCILEKIDINGGEGMISVRNESHHGIIIWTDGIYQYSITGDFDEADLIKLAESVQSDENKNF